jgi:hypothetical protein
MTSPAERSFESRALYALWRNHPLTAAEDRWLPRARYLSRANRTMLLSWAATQPDYRLLECHNIGVATLAWIRDHQPPAGADLLRDWWDSLSELDQFNAYRRRIEKANADALAAPDEQEAVARFRDDAIAAVDNLFAPKRHEEDINGNWWTTDMEYGWDRGTMAAIDILRDLR